MADYVRASQDVPLLFQPLETGATINTQSHHTHQRSESVSGKLHSVRAITVSFRHSIIIHLNAVGILISSFSFLSLSRWVCFCHVPVFCESLQRFDATHVFGRTLLASVFHVMRKQLMEKFTTEQDKMLPEKRSLVLNHFPKLAQYQIVEEFFTHSLSHSLTHSLTHSLIHFPSNSSDFSIC